MENSARQQIETLAILILDDAMPAQNRAGMRGMTKRCSDRRGIVNGPLPAGLISGATKRDAGHIDDLKSAERKFTNLIRSIESLQYRV